MHQPTRADPRDVVRVGGESRRFDDLYHYLLGAPWGRVLGVVAAFYLGINATFATLYVLGGDCIAGARPGSFVDAFFFSVQTFSTIGYGVMAPKNAYASVLVTLEALVGLLGVAMATGLMFSKLSRPTSRVLFSDRMVIAPRGGVPCLMVRMANWRGNDIIEAALRISVLKAEITPEGERFRRFHDLKLLRGQTPLFTISWVAFHPIDDESPLKGETAESIRDGNMRFIVTLTGLDATYAQTIHARKFYEHDHIVWGARFADVMSNTPDGRLMIDFSKFHDVVPLEAAPAEPAEDAA